MDNNTKNSNEYLKTRVLTASPEQLQLMLYDGAICFCEQARSAIGENNIEESYRLINRAEKIVLELFNSMKEEIAPETCANMRSLYLFCYDRLVQANMKKNLTSLDEALRILRHLKETWIMLMEKINEERAEQQPPIPTPQPPADIDQLHEIGANINFEG
jgi:flagellar protein FliS